MQNGKAKLQLGRIFSTPDALRALEDAGQTPVLFLQRHQQGDWGDICDEDKQLNDQALIDGSRVLSAYQTSQGAKIWIITEAADHDGHRVASTILLPENY